MVAANIRYELILVGGAFDASVCKGSLCLQRIFDMNWYKLEDLSMLIFVKELYAYREYSIWIDTSWWILLCLSLQRNSMVKENIRYELIQVGGSLDVSLCKANIEARYLTNCMSFMFSRLCLLVLEKYQTCCEIILFWNYYVGSP